MRKHFRFLVFIIFTFTCLAALDLSMENSPLTPVQRPAMVRGESMINLIIKGDVPESILQAYDIESGGRVGDIQTIRISTDRLDVLDRIPGIETIYPCKRHELLLDDSTSDLLSGSNYAGCNADEVQALGVDGSGVIVAIIDSTPFNWKHEDFTDGGLSGVRTLYIWQQTGIGGSAPSETGCGYGREYTQADLQADNGPATTGTNHGTPCAGIAAGDGSASGGARMGMAPGAEIIYVQVDSYDYNIVDALSYIEQKADALGQSVSVSISLGNKYTIADGTDAVSQAIDSFSAEGRSVSVAAGNYYTTTDHAYGTATYGSPTTDLTLYILSYSDTGTGRYDDYVGTMISYKQGDDFDVTVTSPSGTDYTTTVTDGDETFTTPDGWLEIWHDSGPTIVVVICDTTGTVTIGDEWEIDLTPPDASYDDEGGTWSAYTLENHIGGYFTTYQTGQYTLNEYASGESCICVGAHSKTTGVMYGLSSSGPTSDGRDKPELTAPTNAYAPNTTSTTGYSSLCCTSGATPHVAGAVALMYQKYPDAKPDELRQLMIDTAYIDSETGAIPDDTPDNRWGYGKLNTAGTYEEMPYQLSEDIGGSGNYAFVMADETGAPAVAEIDFTTEDIDRVTLTKHLNEFPPETPVDDRVVRCWFEIETKGGSGTFECDLTLYYTTDELNNGGFADPATSETRLVLYRHNGSEWVEMGGTVDTANNCVTLAGVTEFSNWCITDPDDTTLPSGLINMMCSQVSGQSVLLEWIVEAEMDRLGYMVLRSDTDVLEEAVPLTIDLIPAQNSTSSSSYQFMDDAVESDSDYWYWLQIIEADGTVSFLGSYHVTIVEEGEEVDPVTPFVTRLIGNYPNPFNPDTRISFDLASDNDREPVRLEVFNLKGQRVKVLFDGWMEPGRNRSVVWDGTDESGKSVSSGIYTYRLEIDNRIMTGKALLIK